VPTPTFAYTDAVAYRIKNVTGVKKWLKEVATANQIYVGELTYLLMSDSELLEYNRTYLDHDTLTDIITFDLSDGPAIVRNNLRRIEGNVCISIDRVLENAVAFNVLPERELLRVVAHGLLHLAGYKDKTASQAAAMRKAEDAALALFKS
jgi:probable rRNA maturation factor